MSEIYIGDKMDSSNYKPAAVRNAPIKSEKSEKSIKSSLKSEIKNKRESEWKWKGRSQSLITNNQEYQERFVME